MHAELRQRTRESGLLMLLSGAALAAHFSFWVEGIENTSITHATAFVSVTPIIIAAGMWAFSLPISCGMQLCYQALLLAICSCCRWVFDVTPTAKHLKQSCLP